MTLAEHIAAVTAFQNGVSSRPNVQWAVRSSGDSVQFMARNVAINIDIRYSVSGDTWTGWVSDAVVQSGNLGPVLSAVLAEAQAILQTQKDQHDSDIGTLSP